MENPLEGASLRQLLLILRRRWRLLAAAWAVTVGIAAVYTFTSTKLYRPQASLEIRPETPILASDPADPTLAASRTMWENYYRTQEQILTSSTLLNDVVKALPPAIRREYDTRAEPGRALSYGVDIEKQRTSFVLKVGFVDPDPEKAKQIVNVLVDVYKEDANRRLREMKSGQAELISKEALPSIRQRVDEADKALEQFKTETGYIDLAEQYSSLVDARRKIVGRLTEIRLKRANVRAEIDSLSGYGADGMSALYNPAFYGTRTLEALSEERTKIAEDLARETRILKEKHPRLVELRLQLAAVEEKIREAIQGTLAALQTDLDAAVREEKDLAEEQQKTEAEMSQAGLRLTRHQRLEAELATAKDLYNSYLRKHSEAAATSDMGLGSVRVIDYAKAPGAPFKPNVVSNLWMAAVVGLMLGCGAMLAAEQLDDRISAPIEIEAFLGLEVLGIIPRMTGSGDRPRVLDQDSPMHEFEAFRGLRAQVVTRLEKVGPNAKALAVLSPMNEEGKSTVAINLAKVLAMEGRRVLVFDADMRRPTMRAWFGARKEGPGLEEVLRGTATFDQSVQPSTIAGVDLLGVKEGTSGAGELASSPRYAEAMRVAREKYDIVIVDSPPVNQVSESSLIARKADAALLVTRDNSTGRGSVQAAKKRLGGMDVKIIGAVFNCAVPRGAGYGYEYGYGYGYYYSYYGKDREAK